MDEQRFDALTRAFSRAHTRRQLIGATLAAIGCAVLPTGRRATLAQTMPCLPFIDCGGVCADIYSDPRHCGICGNGCSGLFPICCGGGCLDGFADPSNCGGCGFACGAGEVCNAGSCQTIGPVCPYPTVDCGSGCADLSSDPTNCGACGTLCGFPGYCCAGACTSIQADASHCGACFAACQIGETCCDGMCTSTFADAANCRTCGSVCPAGQVCIESFCTCPFDWDYCPGAGRCCEPPASICCGNACVDVETDPRNCGACGTACPGGRCSGGRCVPTPTDPQTPQAGQPTPTDPEASSDADVVVLLHGFQSSSLVDPRTGDSDQDNHALIEDFARIVTLLSQQEPAPEIIYYSYRAGTLRASGEDPLAAWNGERYDNGGEPVYGSAETTEPSLAEHVAGFDWLLRDLRRTRPVASIVVIGFGLGGVVALAWALQQLQMLATPGADEADSPLSALERLVLLDSPVGGLNPRATSDASLEVRELLRQRGLDLGSGQTILDLAVAGGPLRELLHQPLTDMDVASIENSRDYLVNGLPLPIPSPDAEWDGWIGRGARVLDVIPNGRQETVDLGGADDQLLSAHRMILVSDSEVAQETRERLIDLIIRTDA